ncbi:MAG: hypothetical protein SFV81_04480, partial [Pirellulaceae bacterium]|nr:hypothetical protein [Pirellulaceae bacterium]
MSRHKTNLRGLKLESLEGRSLMAADITLTNDVLNISGSINNDTISVTEIVASSNGWEGPTGPVTGYRATVRNGVTGQVLVSKDYGLSDFKTIVMNGDLGSDRLTNATSKPSIIMGGGGNDVAVGGSSWDIVSLDTYFSNQQAGVDTWGPGLNLRDGILTVPSHSWIAKVDIWINQNIGNGWGGDPVNELVVTY